MSDDPTNSPAAAQVQMIMFGAFAMSHLIMAGVGVFLRTSGDIAPQPEQVEVMLPVLGVVALASLLGSFLGVPALMAEAQYQVYMLLRFALVEAVTIFGLVLCMVGAPLEYCAAFWGVGLAAHLVLAPTQRDRELHAQRRQAKLAQSR